MSLNTDSFILSYRGKSRQGVIFSGKNFEQKGCIKYLVVYIVRNLEFNEYFSYIEGKISQSVYDLIKFAFQACEETFARAV